MGRGRVMLTVWRSTRGGTTHKDTERGKSLLGEDLNDHELQKYDPQRNRPKTRGDCIDGPRPCPYVGCKHHLFLEVKDTGAIEALDVDPTEMLETCVLDVVDKVQQDESVMPDIGKLLCYTRQGINLVEKRAIERMKEQMDEGEYNGTD